jgi:glycosyltransferase involved in cell wall biosynthesis
MAHILNPTGRIIEIDDPKEYKKWLATPGFTAPTKAQIEEYTQKRLALVQEMEEGQLNNTGLNSVYLATVSPGGKDGYGIASDKILTGLKQMGLDVSRENKGQHVGLLLHNPYSIMRMENRLRIIYTMFESTKIPEEWVDYLKEADKVIVPSRFCQQAFKNAGVESVVVPLGYDDSVFKYQERINKRKKNKDFVFLHYNAYNIRKGFLEVVKAFTEEFAIDEPVKLVLKTTHKNPPIPFPPTVYPNIKVIKEALSEAKLVELLKESDAFLFPSRGEGFGMTPLEAMATGLPAIVPNAHGISEYFNENYMYEVKVGEKCPAIYSRYKDVDTGEMVVCDVKHLRQQMRYIYEHQDEAIEKGKLASEYVKNYTFTDTAKKLKGVIDDLVKNPPKERALNNVLTLEQV